MNRDLDPAAVLLLVGFAFLLGALILGVLR